MTKMSLYFPSYLEKYIIQKKLSSNIFHAIDIWTKNSVIIYKIKGEMSESKNYDLENNDTYEKDKHVGIQTIIETFVLKQEYKSNHFYLVFEFKQGISVEDKQKLNHKKFAIAVLNSEQVTKLFFDLLVILGFMHFRNINYR